MGTSKMGTWNPNSVTFPHLRLYVSQVESRCVPRYGDIWLAALLLPFCDNCPVPVEVIGALLPYLQVNLIKSLMNIQETEIL